MPPTHPTILVQGTSLNTCKYFIRYTIIGTSKLFFNNQIKAVM